MLARCSASQSTRATVLDAELEVPEHQRRIGRGDRRLDAGQQHRFSAAGGPAAQVVRVGVEVEHHRFAGLG
jgi:hypothetical protein